MKKLLLIALAGVSFASCSPKNSDDSADTTPEVQVQADPDDVKVLQAYMNLKDAFVSSSPDQVLSASTGMVSMIGGIGNNEELIAIQTQAQKIAEQESIEEQRAVFAELTDDVYKFCKKNPCGKKVYKQNCPMALENTGADWLSTEKEIKNPYFGKVMLKCGKVVEEL